MMVSGRSCTQLATSADYNRLPRQDLEKQNVKIIGPSQFNAMKQEDEETACLACSSEYFKETDNVAVLPCGHFLCHICTIEIASRAGNEDSQSLIPL